MQQLTLREAAEALLQVWDTVGHTSKCGCDACDAMVEVRKALAQPSDEWREGWRAGVEAAAKVADSSAANFLKIEESFTLSNTARRHAKEKRLAYEGVAEVLRARPPRLSEETRCVECAEPLRGHFCDVCKVLRPALSPPEEKT